MSEQDNSTLPEFDTSCLEKDDRELFLCYDPRFQLILEPAGSKIYLDKLLQIDTHQEPLFPGLSDVSRMQTQLHSLYTMGEILSSYGLERFEEGRLAYLHQTVESLCQSPANIRKIGSPKPRDQIIGFRSLCDFAVRRLPQNKAENERLLLCYTNLQLAYQRPLYISQSHLTKFEETFSEISNYFFQVCEYNAQYTFKFYEYNSALTEKRRSLNNQIRAATQRQRSLKNSLPQHHYISNR